MTITLTYSTGASIRGHDAKQPDSPLFLIAAAVTTALAAPQACTQFERKEITGTRNAEVPLPETQSGLH